MSRNTQDSIRERCEELCSILQAKNANYGDTARESPYMLPWIEPQTALWVRMSDKIARLRSLLSKEPDKVGESIRDTLLDLAGYSLLLIMEIDKEKED